jgi:hypothetical protein
MWNPDGYRQSSFLHLKRACEFIRMAQVAPTADSLQACYGILPAGLSMKTSFFALFVCGMYSLLACAQQTGNTIAGCLTGDPGSFVLGVVPSGKTYRLQGDTALLNAHRQQLIRVTGTQSGQGASAVFNVQKLEPVADTCTATLPPQNPNAVRSVTGKTGIEGTAVNKSDTRSAGEVTPGWQTEAGEAQQPGKHVEARPGERNTPPARGALAPPQWDQVGQDQQTADASAAAAQRAEQQPNQTLGVDTMPSYTNPQKPQGSAGTKP